MLCNPKPFADRPHDWDEILIRDGDKLWTRKRIRDYYLRNAKKLLPHLEGRDVMVVLAPAVNDFVVRRKAPDGGYITIDRIKGIDDPKSIEYWANRRVIEFHPMVKKRTDWIWIDVDPHYNTAAQKRKLDAKIRAIRPKLEDIIRGLYPEAKIKTYKSGKAGIHVEGHLPSYVDTDKARRRLRDAMRQRFKDDPVLTTGLAKNGQIRLDITTLKNTGSIRAPYSLTTDGYIKRPYGS